MDMAKKTYHSVLKIAILEFLSDPLRYYTHYFEEACLKGFSSLVWIFLSTYNATL